MKKLFCALSLCLTLALLLASCGNNAEHEHTFGDWETTKNPSCTEKGEKDRFCSCGEKQTVFIAEKGHNYVNGVCDACGGDEVAPCEHKNLEVISGIAPECDKSGLTEGVKCKDCDFVLVEQVEVSKLPHTYTDDFDANCNKCGFERDVNCGHFEVDVLSAREVSCTVDGLTEGKVCKKCEEILQEQTVIPATGHTEVVDDAIPATCTKAGMTEGKHCSVCKVVIAPQSNTKALGHNEGDWIVDTVPTETQDGYKYKFCSRCETKTAGESIPFIGNLGLDYKVNSDGKTCTVMGIGNFKGNELVISEYIKEYKVTAIGERAFQNCTQLTKLVIPETTKAIGARAFYGCTGLTEFTVPASVTSIGTQIFYKAENLSTVYYNSSYSPGNSTANPFLKLSHITKVVFGGSKVSNSILYDCENVTDVVIGDSVTSIGDGAFKDCNSLTSVVIPDGVTSIGYDAFRYCTSLTSVVIPDSVTSIGSYAFYGCTSLTSVVIGDSVTSIGAYAFYGCTSIKSVYITDIEKWCKIDFDSSISNPLCNGADLYLNGKLVTELGITDSVTSIGEWAFEGCISLTSVVIPDSVTSIGNSAFSYCSSLTSVVIPDSVTSIGEYAFEGCTSLTSVVIPDSVTSIGYRAFSGCSSLTSVVIPDSVTSIGSEAFRGCSSLNSVYITNIEKWCKIDFYDSSSNPLCNGANIYLNGKLVTEVDIPDTVTSIEYTFYGCTSLTSVVIPDSVTSIGSGAFDGCTSLTSVVIGDSVTSIGSGAFSGCSSLTSVVIPDSVTSIGSEAFRGCSSLTSVVIPDSVTSIVLYAFEGCSSLTSVVIPDSVTSIGSSAFSGCSSLTSVVIPASVTRIESYAFEDCSSLTIYCEAQEKPSGWGSRWNYSNRLVVWGYKIEK